MQLCDIEQFSERLRKHNQRPLRTLSIELTRRCNFGCGHCYCVSSAKNNRYDPSEELSLSFWKNILDQAIDEGALWLTFTGGEPLLHKDFFEIWKYAKKSGFITTLFSNGSLITPAIADFFVSWTPSVISITLYGASENSYYEMTGKKGMFEKVMQSIHELKSRKINLEIKGIFNTINLDEFDEVRNIALEYCKTFRWDAGLIGSFDSCTNTPQENRLPPAKYVELEKRDPVRLAQMAKAANKKHDINKQSTRAARCNVGNGSAHIDFSGKMHPCLLLDKYFYDLTQGSVHDGWRKAVPELVDTIEYSFDGPCLRCSAVELCGQCVGFAILERSPVAGPVPYRCQLAKERAKFHGTLENFPDLC